MDIPHPGNVSLDQVTLELSAGKDFRSKANRLGTHVGSTLPRCRSIHLVRSLVAASREVLPGRQDLPILLTGRQELESCQEPKSAIAPTADDLRRDDATCVVSC